MKMNFTPAVSKEKARQKYEKHFKKLAKKHPSGIQALIYSEKLGINFTHGDDKPFHIASVGKVFTSTLIEILAERDQLSLNDPIAKFLSTAELHNLFVFENTDFAEQVTIHQLLNHTSGVADYFEDGNTDKDSFLTKVLSNPDTHWTPEMLVNYSRNFQKAVGKPGDTYHYSDTGYILLGLLIEKVTNKPYHQNLHDEFFIPLEMNDSYLMFYSEPKNTPKKPIEKIWINNIEISEFQSLSCDWSGGGIISTTTDLLKFYRALREGKLIEPKALQRMDICENEFRSGIYYGSGMMEIRFEEFFFLLKGFPRIKGHIGILATHLFYDPTSESYIILNFGSDKNMVKSFRTLILIVTILKQIKR